jgi:iron complex outermembrane receptor protein
LSAVVVALAGSVNAAEGIETIVVTAQKRAENVQDVPISMEVVGGDELDHLSINTFEDLQRFVPNFTVQPTPGANQIYIRGIGSGAQNFAFEQAVSLYVDGIYAGRNRQFMAPFFDIERVEVLRGPQGALLGKNTAAGAISLVSAQPTQTMEGFIQVAPLLSRDGVDASGVMSGPITDRLSGRLAMKYTDEDGYVDNEGTGEEVPARDDRLVRGTVTFVPTDALNVTAKLEYSDATVDGTQAISELPGSDFNDERKLTEDPFGFPEIDETKSWNASIVTDLALGDTTFTAITGWSEYDSDKYTGAASADPEDWLSIQTEDFDQFSQEIRLLSPTDGRFDWIVGAYFDTSDFTTHFDTRYDLLGGLIVGRADMVFDQETTTWSAFAQAEWNVGDKLDIIGSARYTNTEKDATLNQFVISGVPVSPAYGPLPKLIEDSLDEDTFDPAVTLRYRFDEDIMAYLTFAQGSKAGGFVSNSGSVTAATFEFDTETSRNVEAGIKATLLEGRLSTAVSIFHTEFDDLQVSNYVPGEGLVIGNAASATTQGAEFSGTWYAARGLILGASVGYLDAEYDEFPGGPCLFGRPCPPDQSQNDIGGTTIPNTSKWSGNVHGEYQFSVLGDLQLTTYLVVAFRSSYDVEADLNPNARQDGYAKLDARVELADPEAGWSLALFGKNLTNKHTFNFSYFWPFGPVPHRLKYLEETRTIELQARYSF